MKRLKPGFWSLFVVIGLVAVACNMPFSPAPTPFVFPTADMTMTALFAPTNTAVPTNTQAPTNTAAPSETPVPPTATPIPPTDTPEPTNTQQPVSYAGPGARSGPHFEAQYVSDPPALNGSWGDWVADEYPADKVTWGKENWKGSDDLSSDFMVEWDYDYLYVAWKVKDDKYVQLSEGANLYEGDSAEILLDTDVSDDYYANWLDWDDYQIGISPGNNEPGENMEAYLWFPKTKTRSLTKAIIGAKPMDGGYRLTVGIPWSTFGIDPYKGMHLGFVASVSDDDSKHGGEQQSMVSSSWRVFVDPTTWGDLVLVK